MEFADYIQILCIPGIGIDKSSVNIAWSQNYYRQSLPLICDKIENEWNKKRITCPSVWNGSKFRLHQILLLKENNCQALQVKLLLGLTCYKDFIGTNCAPDAEIIANLGLKDHGDTQAYASDPLGVGALVVTNDNNIIFIRRSGQCAEFPFMIDRPGGHPEPDVLQIL